MKEIIFNWFSKIPFGHYLQNDYALAILILIGSAILAKIVLFIFEKYLEKLAKKTKTEVDDIIFDRTKKPLFYLILAYGLKLAMYTLQINGVVNKLVNTLMAIVFVFILARVIDVIIEVWGKTVAKKTKSKIDDVLLPLFYKASRVTFVIIGILWTLKIWEINIGPYLAGAGIMGVVLGFALQDSLKNIFGGVTLLLDKTFEIGDKIKLESGDLGEVLDVGLRSTKIRTYDNELIYVPNGYLANSRVRNFTRPNRKLRVSVDFGVQYGSKIKDVQAVVIPVLKKIKTVINDPAPAVHFQSMGDSSLNFKAYTWVENWQDGYSTKLEATEKIYDALNRAKIGIPFPTRTVYVKKEK
jgi:MscS family membrane protein